MRPLLRAAWTLGFAASPFAAASAAVIGEPVLPLELPGAAAIPAAGAAVSAPPALAGTQLAFPFLSLPMELKKKPAAVPLPETGRAVAERRAPAASPADVDSGKTAAVLGAYFDRAGARRPDVEGLFGPDSLMWRINGHHMGRAGGFAALATQAAHPLVAESSKVSRQLVNDPHRRLLRTMKLIERVLFADRRTALDAARQINQRHAGISGTLSESVGRFPAGTPFRAKDPELLKYVLATTYYNTRLYYERFVQRLSEAERERYYKEFKYFGRLLGVPDRIMPADYRGFDAYVEGMIQSADLAVGAAARDLASAFLKKPDLPWPLGPLAEIPVDTAKRLVVGMLPERIRELNELPWGLKDRLLFPVQFRAVKLWMAATPNALLHTPVYYRSMARVAAARWLGR